MALIRPAVHQSSEALDYDGRQLRSHFLREQFELSGDALATFAGRASVKGDDLVDLADREAGLFITSDDMLHLIGEFFGADLARTVLLQRMVVTIAKEEIARLGGPTLKRRGDDLFFKDRKLSVSIATVSPVSGLIHVGINRRAEGAPFEVAHLSELAIDQDQFATGWLKAIADEIESMGSALCKVRAVR